MITIMNNQPTTTTTNIQCGYVGDPPPPTPPPLQQTPQPPPLPQQQLKNSECHHNNNNNNYDNSNSVRLTKTIERKTFSTRCDNRNVVIIKNNNNNTNNNNNLILTNIKNICDCRPHFHRKKRTVKDCLYKNNNNNNVNNNNNNSKNSLATIITNIYLFILLLYTCLFQCKFLSSSIVKITQNNNNNNNIMIIILLLLSSSMIITVDCYPNEFDKTEQLLDKLNLEKSIAAVFNKVAYGGSTTKRSIPDNIYPITTLSTPLLTTYRYSDGNDEWLRVDLKNTANNNNNNNNNRNVNFDNKEEYDNDNNEEDSNEDHRIDNNNNNNYGVDLEKDHVLPTSAPAADILKNNNNKNYNNPNRYNNDRLRPDYDGNNNNNNNNNEQVTENIYKTTTTYNLLRNIRPTKSMYSKDIPSYVPPSRAFFTPPLPPEYQNPFADTPTLRGKNSDSFASRRPIPPPSLMPNKDRIPFRPDLPPNKVNVERQPSTTTTIRNTNDNDRNEKKKTLNTPSNVRLNEFYGINRSNLHHNNNSDSFEYEKSYAPEPSITRILSGSNGRHDDVKIPDILYHTVTATPQLKLPPKLTTTTQQPPQIQPKLDTKIVDEVPIITTTRKNVADVVRKEPAIVAPPPQSVAKDVVVMTTTTTTTTEISVNLPNIREKTLNATQFTTEKIWLICWNVHIYLVVFVYIILAIYSIYKLICYENDPHMFSKSYFLTIHLMLTVICVLRIFYLIYDAYNINKSFNVFIYEFLHNFPLSLLATTFSVLILFLLKRTLIHLEVKNPIILVVFAIIYILLCFCLSIFETFNYFDKANLIICRPIYVLLVWSLGCSYLYLYRIIKNVLSKKSQNLSELCTQNILYASHITIAIALLFILLGVVQLYSLFFIKIDHFDANTLLIQQHWILWGYELSIRFIEITIIILLSLVVSLKLSQRNNKILNNEKHNNTATGFQLFPCTTTTNTTTSDSSTDNIYPNNCNTNPNAINYSRNEMLLDNLNDYDNSSGGGGNNKKSTLERFERPNWQITEQPQQQRNSMTKRYQKPKYDLDYDDYQQQNDQPNITVNERNIYSEPIDNNHHQLLFERSDFDRRSRNSSTHTTTSSSSGRRSTTGRQSSGRKNLQYHPHHQQQQRPTTHLSGIQTLPPPHQLEPQRTIESMLVDEQGFVRFRHIQDDLIDPTTIQTTKHKKQHLKKMMQADINHYSDA